MCLDFWPGFALLFATGAFMFAMGYLSARMLNPWQSWRQ
jgi:hypothetical protein